MKNESTELSDLLKEALDLWVDFSGVDPEAKSWEITMSDSWDDFDFRRSYEQLQKSLKSDPTGVTACMLLRAYLENYQKCTSIPLTDILEEPEEYIENLRKFKRLKEIVENSIVAETVDDFKDFIVKAAKHYEYDETKVSKLFDNREHIGMSRFYALEAAKKLTEYQFSRGKHDKKIPMIYKGILKFPSIQMAINFLASHEESLIALALIRDEYNDFYSHFAFLIKNGENTFLLSDDEKWVHPMQKKMSRRPDRHLDRKEFVDYLPYQLMDKFDNEKVDPDQSKATLLSPIKDLPVYQIVWLTVLFEKLRQNFWDKRHNLKQLSHFMGTVSDGYSSVKQLNDAKRDASNFPVHIPATKLPKVTNKEVTTESMINDWDHEPTRQNEWLEKRYEKLIPDFAINPDLGLLDEKELKLLEDGKDESNHKWFGKEKPKPLIKRAIQGPVNKEALKHCSDLKVMPETNFGTMESLQKTQRWHSRYNKATLIKYYAQKEYEDRHEEVIKWLKNQAQSQKDRLIKIAITGEFKSQGLKSVGFGTKYSDESKNFLSLNRGEGPISSSWGHYWAILGEVDYHKSKYYCPITGAVATLFAVFEPKTAIALADVLGCKVKDLPDVMRNWWKGNAYYGNSILDNVDPMEWVVDDPWSDKITFAVIIPFSKRAFKQLRKEAGLEPLNFDDLPEKRYGRR